MCQTVYSNVKSYLTQPKYQNMEKQSLRRFVHFNKIFHSRKPKFTGFFKGSWMFQQNSEYRSNNRWKRHIFSMGKELRNPFACNDDQRIDTGESQMSDWAGLILGQIPQSKEQRSSQMPRVCPRGMGDFRIDWFISGVDLVWKSDFHSFSVEFKGSQYRYTKHRHGRHFWVPKILWTLNSRLV